jgi:hypothetical protein
MRAAVRTRSVDAAGLVGQDPGEKGHTVGAAAGVGVLELDGGDQRLGGLEHQRRDGLIAADQGRALVAQLEGAGDGVAQPVRVQGRTITWRQSCG